MDKAKARKMYELATRLSSVNANELSEQQLSERNSMITRLQEEMTKMREGHTVPTATGVRHQASPGVYGGSDRDEDPDTKLDKNFVNRAEKAIGIKWGREKKRAPGINLDDSLNGMAEGEDDKFSVANKKVEELVDKYRLYDKRGWTELFAKLAGRKLEVAEIRREMEYASKFLQLLDSIRMRSDYQGQQGAQNDQELIDLSNQWLSLFNMAVIEFKAMRGQGVTEEIIGQPDFEHTGNAGYGSYGAAEYTATTKHRLGSHVYEVTTEQDGDGDFSYFIYENDKEIFSSIQPSNKNQLGHRISSALLDEHKKATAHLFDSEDDDYYEAKQGVAEDGQEDMSGAPASGAVHYNVGKLSKEIGTDPRQLKIAIQRSITGNPTRQDTLTVANAFISILKTGDDQTIQNIANIIKAGNPRKDSAQESVAPKVTKAEEVKEEINTEAYNRLRKVFDFSNFKG